MNMDNRNNMMQAALRCGVSLFMLSGACVLNAQVQEPEGGEATPAPAKVQQPAYQMKEVKGIVLDAATKQPLAGARVQALNNRFYTAMTDENGAYAVNVPEHVTALYIVAEGYNAVQVGLHGQEVGTTLLYSEKIKPLYTDGIKILLSEVLNPNTSSALTVENDIENTLNASVRTINRGGMLGKELQCSSTVSTH